MAIPPAPLGQSSNVGQKLDSSQQEGLIHVNEDTLVGKELSVKYDGQAAKQDSSN